MKRLGVALLVVLLAVVPARAESAAQVAAALRTSPVYQSSGLDLVDVATLTSELTGADPRVVVAVLPASAAASGREATQRAVEIGNAMAEPGTVVLVITEGQQVGAAQGVVARAHGIDADKALQAELATARGKTFDKSLLTAFVTSFAEDVRNQAAHPQNGVSNGDTPVDTGGGSNAGPVGLAVLGLVVVGGIGLAVRSSRRRRAAAEPSTGGV